MVLCYYTDEVKSFGWEKVLRPVVEEMRHLESEGMLLKVNGEMKKVRILLSGITGDNLFLNGILGFTECFTAKFPCRHCLVPGDAFQSAFIEDEKLV